MIAAVEYVLLQQGFTIHQLGVVRHGARSFEFAATHAGSNSLYYVSLHWVEKGSVSLGQRLTDGWFNKTISNNAINPRFAPVRSAWGEGRLVRIVAGIQWPIMSTVPPTVYFVKVSPS